jgi:hypothetical protein
MSRPRAVSVSIDAFYDNFTCAALFHRLHIPGAPKEIVDPRPAHTFWVDESQQILTDVMAKMRAARVLALVGVFISAFRTNDLKKPSTKGEDVESALADWSSFIKP